MRKNDAFVAKIVNTGLTKIFMAILPPTKGCQVMPSWWIKWIFWLLSHDFLSCFLLWWLKYRAFCLNFFPFVSLSITQFQPDQPPLSPSVKHQKKYILQSISPKVFFDIWVQSQFYFSRKENKPKIVLFLSWRNTTFFCQQFYKSHRSCTTEHSYGKITKG